MDRREPTKRHAYQADHVESAVSKRAFGITDRGRVRDRNEDAFYVNEAGTVMVVADGLGGLPAGDKASVIATDMVAILLDRALRKPIEQTEYADWSELMLDTFEVANEAILVEAADNVENQGMSTTLVAAVVDGDRMHCGHIGDVRCYTVDATGCHQITTDHSEVSELVASGELTEEQARTDPRRHVVTQALGISGPFDVGLNDVELAVGDHVLLCSDGLWEALSPDDIVAAFRDADCVRDSGNALLELAMRHGGHDNITAVLYTHEKS